MDETAIVERMCVSSVQEASESVPDIVRCWVNITSQKPLSADIARVASNSQLIAPPSGLIEGLVVITGLTRPNQYPG